MKAYLARLLEELLALLRGRKKPAGSFRFIVYPYRRKEVPHVQIIIPHNMKAHIAVDPQDADGNPAPLDGDALWSSSNDATAAIEIVPETGGKEVYVIPGEIVGEMAQLTVTGDARIGEAVNQITGTVDVLVSAGEATGFGVRVVGFEPK